MLTTFLCLVLISSLNLIAQSANLKTDFANPEGYRGNLMGIAELGGTGFTDDFEGADIDTAWDLQSRLITGWISISMRSLQKVWWRSLKCWKRRPGFTLRP